MNMWNLSLNFQFLSPDSTNQECFSRPMGVLVEAIQGKQQPQQTAGVVSGPIKPLSMSILDSLTVHTKMRFFLFLFLYLV